MRQNIEHDKSSILKCLLSWQHASLALLASTVLSSLNSSSPDIIIFFGGKQIIQKMCIRHRRTNELKDLSDSQVRTHPFYVNMHKLQLS